MKMKKNNQDTKHYFYANYCLRVTLMTITCLLLLIGGIVSFIYATNHVAAEKVNYSEKGNVDYLVYLNENDFYEDDSLLPGMSYIASIIKNITINYNYTFKIDKEINANFYYDIVGTLVISDASEENVFFTKDYSLLKDQTEKVAQGNRVDISKSVTIDYASYNKLAQSFKETYGVDTVSSLTVSLKLNKLSENTYQDFNKEKVISLKIPLTEKAVNIQMKPVELTTNSQIIKEEDFKINNYPLFILSIIIFILLLILITKIIQYLLLLIPKKNKFQKKVNKILKTYDRLIANVKTLPNFNDYDIYKIDSFSELVDIRDNLKLPIMYYNVKENEKCYFYIESNNKLYLLTLKAVDFEKKETVNLDKDKLQEKTRKQIEESFTNNGKNITKNYKRKKVPTSKKKENTVAENEND